MRVSLVLNTYTRIWIVDFSSGSVFVVEYTIYTHTRAQFHFFLFLLNSQISFRTHTHTHRYFFVCCVIKTNTNTNAHTREWVISSQPLSPLYKTSKTKKYFEICRFWGKFSFDCPPLLFSLSLYVLPNDYCQLFSARLIDHDDASLLIYAMFVRFFVVSWRRLHNRWWWWWWWRFLRIDCSILSSLL